MRARRYTGSALWSRMTNSFGYLNKLGYAGHLFPIVIGETGSFYTSAQVRCLHLLQRLIYHLLSNCAKLPFLVCHDAFTTTTA